MTAKSRIWPVAAAATTICMSTAACLTLHAQSLREATSRVFATDTTAEAPALQPDGPAAAVVGGHVIPMKYVVAICLRDDRSNVVDQMVQDYVVDRECARQGIVVTDADIDKQVDTLRKNLAPATLESVIAVHHSSMDFVRNAFKENTERIRLVLGQVAPTKIVHCRAIVIRYASPGMPESIAGTTRTQADAQTLVQSIQAQLARGKDFGDLADSYSEATPKKAGGDMGMLYSGVHDVDPAVVNAAISLTKGQLFTSAVNANNTYVLLKATSTSDDHASDEDAAYADTLDLYRNQQAQFLYPKFVVSLIDKSHITFELDADAIARSGKPLPEAAAVIDGHVIPMKDVVAKCVAEDGPAAVDTLVQNYLVDTECKRLGITVLDAQIDKRTDNLRLQIAPHTIDEGLKAHRMTMQNLRYDFRQEIERSRLVEDQVKPTKIVHCRAIMIQFAPANEPQSSGGTSRTEEDALALINDIQRQLSHGKDFASLAAHYSEAGPRADDGDIGMLYQGLNNMETPMLDAGLALDKGQISPSPIKLIHAYCLIQAISTSSSHPKSEDSAYIAALTSYKEQRAPMLESQEIIRLIKESRVVYYIHA